MIVSMLKKICFMSIFVTLCAVCAPVKKNNDDQESKRSKSILAQCATPRCNQNTPDNDCSQVRDLIERQLTDRLRRLNADLEQSFSTQNAFICNKIELLTACLDEFIATQQRASDTRLKDFITCSLDRMETQVEEFTRFRITTLENDLCNFFEGLNSDIKTLICNVDIIDTSVDCVTNILFKFLTISNALPFFSGALDDAISAAEICLDNDTCLLTCSDALPTGCISDLATVGCNTAV